MLLFMSANEVDFGPLYFQTPQQKQRPLKIRKEWGSDLFRVKLREALSAQASIQVCILIRLKLLSQQMGEPTSNVR